MPSNQNVESWTLPVAGLTVSEMIFGFSFDLHLFGSDPRDVRIDRWINISFACPCSFLTTDDLRHDFDPREAWSTMAPLLELRSVEAINAVIDARSNLEITFSGGSILSTDAGPNMSGWRIEGSDGLLLHGNKGYDPRCTEADLASTEKTTGVWAKTSPFLTPSDKPGITKDPTEQ